MSKMPSDGLSGDEMEGMVPVILPSGAAFLVHDQEVQYFKQRASKYMADNDFVNISDLQDMDRLLIMELMCHRWGLWIISQRDYWGEGVDENTLQKALKDHSAEARQLKKEMGLDRSTREKIRGEDSVENYLKNLRERALHFGYMRNEQAAAAIELFMELQANITLHDNCTEKERIERNITMDDVIKWIREDAIPRFNKIDEEFRKEQSTWIRRQ